MKPSVALTTALSGAYLARAIVVMIIVGSVLNLINQGEALFQGAQPNFAKLLLTYVVPFCVSTYGTWSADCGTLTAFNSSAHGDLGLWQIVF